MNQTTRRDFLSTSTAAGLALLAGAHLKAAAPAARLKKAMILRKIDEPGLLALKEAGFDGAETNTVVETDVAAAGRAIAEKLGMQIHSVSRGWAEFNSPDPAKVADTLAVTEKAIRAAAAFGGNTILLVPCRATTAQLPEAREFDIVVDEKTAHVKQLVRGDNSKYADYIAAQNHATDTSRLAVEKLIPLAEKNKVVICLENVWNFLWVKPNLFKAFVASFNSPWVKAYFDIGNYAMFAPPAEWITTLGSHIGKCHIKDFLLNDDGKAGKFTLPKQAGKFVHPRDGSIDWPATRKALAAIGYDNNWLTIEDGGLPLKDFSQRLDLIIAGK